MAEVMNPLETNSAAMPMLPPPGSDFGQPAMAADPGFVSALGPVNTSPGLQPQMLQNVNAGSPMLGGPPLEMAAPPSQPFALNGDLPAQMPVPHPFSNGASAAHPMEAAPLAMPPAAPW